MGGRFNGHGRDLKESSHPETKEEDFLEETNLLTS